MNKKERMTPRERVISALKRQPHDRVPWIEGIVGDKIATEICGIPVNVNWSPVGDYSQVKSGIELAEEQKKVNRVFKKDNINFNAFAPVFVKRVETPTGNILIGDGIIKTEEDFERYFKLPCVDSPALIKNAKDFIAHKEEYCAIATIRLGIGSTLLSMGIEGFSYAMVDNIELIREIHNAYCEWNKKLIPVLEDIGFDAFWAFDDIAFDNGPIFSPSFYKTEILPVEKKLREMITKPLITHSDGKLDEVLPLWLELKQSAVHPVQPDVMDIYELRKKLPEEVGIVGNIDMQLLSKGTPEEVEKLIVDRFEKLKPTQNYLISSSNSITDNMKVENVKKMMECIERYGYY